MNGQWLKSFDESWCVDGVVYWLELVPTSIPHQNIMELLAAITTFSFLLRLPNSLPGSLQQWYVMCCSIFTVRNIYRLKAIFLLRLFNKHARNYPPDPKTASFICSRITCQKHTQIKQSTFSFICYYQKGYYWFNSSLYLTRKTKVLGIQYWS